MEETRAMKRYTEWVNRARADKEMLKDLRNLITKPGVIEEEFSAELDFGTAGLRALMGPGPSRMNIYTVAAAAKGCAQYLLRQEGEAGAVISYDSRHGSKLFAEITAKMLASSGVHVYLFREMHPVPMLSFAVRRLSAAGGVMITASHNPKEYNGFKVYRADGAQLTDKEAAEVSMLTPMPEEIFEEVAAFDSLKDYLEEGTVEWIPEDIDRAYMNYLIDSVRHHEIGSRARADVRIVYSPLHGTGARPLLETLHTLGYEKVFEVHDQMKPDGDFPTVRCPNPEYDDTYDEALRFAHQVMADIVLLTDPDADRLGVAVYADGEYHILNGNQIGCILMEFLLSTRAAKDAIPENGFAAISVVSSHLARAICGHYGVKLYETLTGSKNTAALIREHQDEGEEHFLFGFEESHGYLFGGEVRDKDAIAAALIIAEMTTMMKPKGIRLYSQLEAIYNLYGYASEKSLSIEYTSDRLFGKRRSDRLMEHFRSLGGKLGEEDTSLGQIEVSGWHDFMPEANVLLYRLRGLDWMAFRPSGTEPKFKVYLGFYGKKSVAESRAERTLRLIEKELRDYFGA